MSTWRYNYPEHPGLEKWLNSGERGMSSEAIVQYLVNGKLPGGFNDPADAGDFRRCENLLRAVPTLRDAFPLMAEASPRWAELVKHWDDLVAQFEAEAPGVFDMGRYARWSAPKTGALVRNPEAIA